MSHVDPAEAAARLRVVITRLFRAMRSSSPGGLTPSQWSALATVETHQPVRVGDVADREGVSAPTATRVVASLEALGLVGREVDPQDRRSAHVSLTDAGREKLELARNLRTAALSKRLLALPPDDMAQLAGAIPLLERLVAEEV
jgi:DNA-binding MarR family transcriptional regulator